MAKELTVSEAAQLAGYSERHVRRLARQGQVDARQVGGWLYLIDRQSLMEYAEKMKALGQYKYAPDK